MRHLILAISLVVALPAVALAQPADAGVALVDAGSASAPVEKPADKLHDPIAAPAATIDDVKAAKKLGWGIAVLAVLVIASRLAARMGGVFSVLGKGKVSLGIAAVGSFAVTAFNAVSLGGSWFAALLAALVAAAAAWDSKAKPAPTEAK